MPAIESANPHTRAAVYCRLSEEDRVKDGGDSVSIANQKKLLIDFVSERGWELVGVYSDDDYTGADRRRPEFNRLLADAEARRFDVLVCKSQSRFTRELELVERYIHGLFPLWGVRFIGLADNADTENRGNKKSRQINGLVNEWYLEDLSDNIRSVLDSRRRNGLHIGAFALYGYIKDPAVKGHLLIDPPAAEVVREVFELYALGTGKAAIARLLNARGVPNPTEYKRRQGLTYKQPSGASGGLWRYAAISSMLRNEMYIGCMVQGRYGSVSCKTKKLKPRPRSEWFRVENTHEAIISRELWNRVRELDAEHSKPFAGGELGLFAGKARCASCGYVLHSSVSGGKRYLSCPTRRLSRESCPGAFISVERLEREVLERLVELGREGFEARLPSRRSGRRELLEGEIESIRRGISELSRQVRELWLDKSAGLLCESDFRELSCELTRRRAELERLESVKAAELASLPESGEALFPPEQLTRELVCALIREIRVGTRVAGTKSVPIEVVWT